MQSQISREEPATVSRATTQRARNYLEAKTGGGRKKKKFWLACRGRDICCHASLGERACFRANNPTNKAPSDHANNVTGASSGRGSAANLAASTVAGRSLCESSFAAETWADGL